ncbi:sensor histidine kinase [Mucilaginibacter sp. E4BP6]|uniref:sensor histidine kinase n=1 Tax=Mucilaginibacter sp. E4BP6 TaxID=2723089 RepID=UPI0015CEA57E|nr:sensor histidine kinase [Mucilaginibacter sp. E4BP6]NYE67042.1 two-component sensor histidine kinase [Mucilaginibacter sp. E4BP6]
MIKKAILILLLFLSILSAGAQDTRGTLGVTHFERTTTLNKLFKAVAKAPPDTNKVNLYIQISSIYWRKERPIDIDSCIYYADKALELSKSLHYQVGNNEALFLKCKGFIKMENINAAKALLTFVHGEMRIRVTLAIAEYYVFLPEQKEQNLDKAYPMMVYARTLCDSIHSSFWRQYYLLLYAKYYFEKNEYDKGKAEMMQIILDYKKKGDIASQAEYWNELEIYLPLSDRAYADKVYCLDTSLKIYKKINHGEDASYVLRDLAELNMEYGHLDSARKQIIRFIQMQARLKIKMTFNSHIIAAQIFTFSGNLVKGLDYLLPTLNMTAELKDKLKAQQLIADIYFALGSYSKSIYFDQQALAYCLETNKLSAYAFCHRIVLNLIALGQTDSLLTFLNDIEAKYPPIYINGKEYLALCYGDAYSKLGNYKEAERKYLEMISDDREIGSELNRTLEGVIDNIRINSIDAYIAIVNFYVGRKQYTTAIPYLNYAWKINQSADLRNNNIQIPLIAREMKLEFNTYKIDSAAGQFTIAIQHLNRYNQIKDSVFSITKSTPFEELRLQYKAREGEQSIKLLKEESRQKDQDLKALNQQRNFTIAGILILVIVVVVIYLAYKGKQNANQQLEAKQKEINSQNVEINQKNIFQEHLLLEKEKLIEDKELLVKEVNHRVKNNLQVMISLLNKQSSFLSDEALEAVIDSKNRMQAIATLHQKFYGETNTACVNMKEYVFDFLRYLSYSLNSGKNEIKIHQNIEIEMLNISMAAPLGLILNEAVTNSIKHAFKGKKGGSIRIDMVRVEEMIKMSITDNGKGLPLNFELKKGKSMGMELMTALTKQLGGELKITSEGGLQATVIFKENIKKSNSEKKDLS